MSDIGRPTLALWPPETHRVGGNRKRYKQSRNADQKSIETVFSIAICRQWGVKWQSKTLFLLIFDLRSSIVLAFSIAAYPVCESKLEHKEQTKECWRLRPDCQTDQRSRFTL